MENASKALIIAGAILLSIAIIGIGMSVFNSASETVNKSNLTGQELEQFNAQFEGYEGNVKGSNLKSLYSKVIANNEAEKDVGDREVTINAKNAANDLSSERSKIKSSKTYKVEFEYADGRISNIKVTGEGITAAAGTPTSTPE